MTNPVVESHYRYPLLEPLLAERGLSPKGIYTNVDVAQIFAVSKRTIQEWLRDGRLIARDLPGRGRYLSEDLELFLQRSVRKPRKVAENPNESVESARARRRVPGRQRKGDPFAI